MKYIFLDLPILIIKLVMTLLVYLTPVLGVWLVSSLVAYVNGPMWLSLFSGILLFPLLPITWELNSRWRRRHSEKKTPNILTFSDRLTLRTLALNLIFIASLLALRPQTSFLALSTRGDWMLDHLKGTQVEVIRQVLFKAANTLEGLYLVVRKNPFEQYANPTKKDPFQQLPVSLQPTQQNQQNSRFWPWEGSTIHPAVSNMPASVEVSIESVAQYIAAQETDPFLRIKALHDYVADRITYDVPAYLGQIPRPSQDAQTVFHTRKAVCAGYAKLLEALGKSIGEEIVYITGDARTRTSDLSGQGHAWNAAKIQENWYLIDTTWDSGYVNDSGFTKNYRSDYLLTPPEVMIISHFPKEADWQLLATPLSLGDFLRQPMLQPAFFAQGFKLLSPTRSQTDVSGNAVIKINNPRQRFMQASWALKGQPNSTNCTRESTEISCPLPNAGTYEVKLFSSQEEYGKYQYVGQLEFNKRS
ncbi:transglutaminase [[Phormidium ambiguum] IAM M-71]|uniref:Transglutaminase n=1 Tax=[Phormidium ambiguum] IAM M-71 TaxID=454136 RepID=A0A1U7I866_9CYAN|nr:transglutaminase domain-containing protein [Phormidium ambiguum]OKH32556.1 transglutaminase [Phormidium ambiguum IAM M-71]